VTTPRTPATVQRGGAGDRSGAAGAPSLTAGKRGVAGRSGAASAPAIIAAAHAAGERLPARFAGLPVARVVPLATLAPQGVLDARGLGGLGARGMGGGPGTNLGGMVGTALQSGHLPTWDPDSPQLRSSPIPVVSKVTTESGDEDQMFRA